jgi:hypothetical protein
MFIIVVIIGLSGQIVQRKIQNFFLARRVRVAKRVCGQRSGKLDRFCPLAVSRDPEKT